MDFWRSVTGIVTVELTSADPAGALQAANAAGITLYNTRQMGDLTLRFDIHRADYRRLRKIAKKRGERLTYAGRQGIFWSARQLLGRPVLVLGIVLIVFLTFYLPTRVLFVQVEGNTTIPSRKILEAASECGIIFGTSRREVRSEKMKNALLSAIPELQWAGINTEGCRAVISVRERTKPEQKEDQSGICSIVAARDGVIQQLTVTNGNPICKVGQAVKAGQVLVSGYTDCGICIRATHAEAEVYAQTQRILTAVTPSEYVSRYEITASEKKYSLIIGKKRINFYKGSGISGSSCVKMYSEKYLTLPGGYRLPVALAKEEWVQFRESAGSVDEKTANGILNDFAERYLTAQMIAGQITRHSRQTVCDDGVYRQLGIYACAEMIGITRFEENLEHYEAD